jgi:hypothetical protein
MAEFGNYDSDEGIALLPEEESPRRKVQAQNSRIGAAA